MASRRVTLVAFAIALAAGLAVLLFGGITTKSRLVTGIGVVPLYPVAPIAPGQEACQAPIGLADPVDRMRVSVGTSGRPGVPLEMTVRAAGTAIVLGHGRIPGGWVDVGKPREVSVGHIGAGQRVSACIRNLGHRRAFVFGDIYGGSVVPAGPLGLRPTPSNTSATVDNVPIPGDLAISFVTNKPRSLLTRLPAVLRHAAVFRPPWVGAWTFWLLLIAAVLLAPLALGYALLRTLPREAADEPPPLDDVEQPDATLSHR